MFNKIFHKKSNIFLFKKRICIFIISSIKKNIDVKLCLSKLININLKSKSVKSKFVLNLF